MKRIADNIQYTGFKEVGVNIKLGFSRVFLDDIDFFGFCPCPDKVIDILKEFINPHPFLIQFKRSAVIEKIIDELIKPLYLLFYAC